MFSERKKVPRQDIVLFLVFIFWWVPLLATAAFFMLGWRVGVWLSDPILGLRKLRPQVELQFRREQGESLGNGAETKRPPG